MRRLLVFPILLASLAHGHEARPLYVELTQTDAKTWQLQWKTPPSVPAFAIPDVALLGDCDDLGPPAKSGGQDALVLRRAYTCAQGLTHGSLTIGYPGPNPSLSSLVRYRTLTGEEHTVILRPDTTQWHIPAPETGTDVAGQYTFLGMEHIWGGADHLLFVLCLLWVAGTGNRILITISGFTLAHSVTLIMSALNLVRVSIPPVEASIALSIVFLATEIARGSRDSLTWRYPVAVSSSFGMLHGFGFAAALKEIGLPQTEVLIGLLFFNVGVEIGQVVFAAGTIGLIRLLRRPLLSWISEQRMVTTCRLVTSYVVGTVASLWLIERLVRFTPA